MKTIKVLLIGDDSYQMYAKAFYDSFLEMGYDVDFFPTNYYMEGTKYGKLILRAENKFAYGPKVSNINRKLIKRVKELKPALVFLYSSRLIYAKTIKILKELGNIVFIYNNDDPFAEYYPKYFWRHFRKSLKFVDVGFAYRYKNIEEFYKTGCKKVELLRAYYMKNRNYYIEEVELKEQVPAVVFLGHNEADERQKYIKMLLDEKIEVGVTSRTWEEFEVNNPYLVRLKNSHEKYNEMINAAKIAIVFLSKINNDTYTRRCFEIPATKTLMVAPYTKDIASMFKENEEVILFRNGEEFVKKVKFYLENPEQRRRIAEAGFRRLIQDGHEVQDRIQQIMEIYNQVK